MVAPIPVPLKEDILPAATFATGNKRRSRGSNKAPVRKENITESIDFKGKLCYNVHSATSTSSTDQDQTDINSSLVGGVYI